MDFGVIVASILLIRCCTKNISMKHSMIQQPESYSLSQDNKFSRIRKMFPVNEGSVKLCRIPVDSKKDVGKATSNVKVEILKRKQTGLPL